MFAQRRLMACLTALCAGAVLLSAPPAQARQVCMIVATTAGDIVHEQGDCRSRVTPASTFKVALSLIGFDTGVLTGAHHPVMDFRKGDPAWGGEAWLRPTDPASWLKYSVVWYSQRITRDLGEQTLTRYAQAFGYGNADFSGDAGKNNGLERAWIASSLKISPAEQVMFLGKLVAHRLPVSADALETTEAIMDRRVAGDWTVSGKTGAAYPRLADGSFDRSHGWGWYVGWARRADQTLVFARLDQDQKRQPGSPGLRTRDALLGAWPALADTIRN
ncbi:class D beta-lactamase [uncultured Hoeflea sp.]|uniref:class D beta-lactamase n=1 Tax=uncultured Hoeflea sp. TaxID=538666 RepID=UPI0030DDB3BA|tara:strand:+ start:1581 stop:2405 length:825 start_codon:yes stop_codon:yes gene_type:complete